VLSPPGYLTTYPCWSPDGRWLYFSRAPRLWTDDAPFPPPQYDQVRYSLMRVAYDPASGTWGQAEMVRSGEAAARSFVFPRLSPDGRWLLYTSCDYGCFPIHRPNSDLELLDLATGRDVPVEINSERADTWHSWSRNGRWIVFSSKRADGLFTKLYLSYFDERGHFHPPLLLPQRDPWFYESFWYSYNVPELIDQPIRFTAGQLGRAVRSRERVGAPLPPEVALPTPATR
jgi:Tol biopolymer transport system component